MKKTCKFIVISHIFTLFIIFFILLFLHKPVFAENLVISPENIPLFSEKKDGLFFPGKSVTRKVKIENSTNQKQLLTISPKKTPGKNLKLVNILQIKIKDNFGKVIYGESKRKYLSDFLKENKYPLSILDPNTSITYSFVVTMDNSAGNKWQNKKTGLNLEFEFSKSNPQKKTTP